MAGQLSRLDLVVLDELGYLLFASSSGQLLLHLISSMQDVPRVRTVLQRL